MQQGAEIANNINKDLFEEISQRYKLGLSEKFQTLFNKVPNETLAELINGNFYKDGKGLNRRIWFGNQKVNGDIDYIIQKGIAQGKSSYDLAKDLETYVNPDARKDWQWSKVYPKSGKTIDFCAQRLARTAVSHAYTLSLLRSCEFNPYITTIRWHSVFAPGRTCPTCKERDRIGIYKLKDCPMDHPNGLCWQEPILDRSLNGMGSELNRWIKGEKNPTLDNWAKGLGYDFNDKPIESKTPTKTNIITSLAGLTQKYGVSFEHEQGAAPIDVRVYDYIDKTIQKVDSKLPKEYNFKNICDKVVFEKYDEKSYTQGDAWDKQIGLNSWKFNKEHMDDKLENLEKYYNSPNMRQSAKALNPLSTFTHEVGHLVHDELLRQTKGVDPSGQSASILKKQNSAIRTEVLDKFDLKATKKYEGDIGKALSYYATESPHEFFAECFMEWIDNPNPRPMATEFGKILTRILNESIKNKKK